MLNSKIIITLGFFLIIAVYFLGKSHAKSEIKQTVINNVNIVKEIAELAALSVQGSTTVKLTNSSDNQNWFGKFKNYLAENTLLVTIPFEAKFGLNLGSSTPKSSFKNNEVTLQFPACKLLSLQLKLDELQTMNQTGLFNTTTIKDLAQAQKQLYQQAIISLSANKEYIQKAETSISVILQKYFSSLGIKVVCTFEK